MGEEPGIAGCDRCKGLQSPTISPAATPAYLSAEYGAVLRVQESPSALLRPVARRGPIGCNGSQGYSRHLLTEPGDLVGVAALANLPGALNPRPRAGGDTASASATDSCRFNPRPRAGGDICGVRRTTQKFQSTPPRGGRRRHPKPFPKSRKTIAPRATRQQFLLGNLPDRAGRHCNLLRR